MVRHLRVTALLLGVSLLGLVWALGPFPARAATPAFVNHPVVLLTCDVADGTGAGSDSAGVWTTRALNSEIYDPANIVTLAQNRFKLAPGTYLIEADQTIFGDVGNPKGFKGRIRNITDGTTAAVSLNVRLHEETNESATIVCPIPKTLLTLSASKTFELQYYCETADALPYGLGYPLSGTGEVERYASVFIQKLD
jgi:hypothetical protein